MNTSSDLDALVQSLAQALLSQRLLLVTAESCTGGGVARACTDLAGSSDWIAGGFVTYSNQAKSSMIGVPSELIAQHGAVSEPVARAMAEGALSHSEGTISVAITGVAGPGGGSPEKPVGTVWFAWSLQGGATVSRCALFSGDRASVRAQAVAHAIQGLIQTALP
ncbi:MAG: CinA family protein [Granulosicoccaceae bacterium]